MYRQIHRTILDHLSTGRPMYQLINGPINRYTWWRYSISEASVQYWWSIGEVSVNHQVHRLIGVSVDTSVDVRPIYRPILDWVSTDVSTDALVTAPHGIHDSGWTSHMFLWKMHWGVYMLDRVAHLPGPPCLFTQGAQLGRIAFYHVNSSRWAILASRDKLQKHSSTRWIFL